ncbi:AraC family transcriptional regulator [Mesorhizobium sp. M7A.T.Ca.TU.009.01.3.2]|nr:AraC family transcriptional regulator [Mesorhizobium sp. M7A.T.Ca.TU.009.01.3.2]RUV09971.1 AraC family transcriptional regulator [Mesorhizobium sp. M7A.T.Ca.TU.009.01.3.1]RUV22905.1 AraC family transcriptional regulator [Mesorhizobium sp. M7A.F.Ca.MR.245.00.0.0]RUV49330.1 AraC family transcriptional regulator [Mesorhizobium sp. M7A.F.Ca.MR.228.00.0.0]TJV24593.1 MAG: helix-turn-helix domain-containing protein [Mesorhizobium sp.]
MESRIEGFSVIGDLKWHVWDGVVADLWDVSCGDKAEGYYVSPDPRLFVALDVDGDGAFFVESAKGELRRHDQAFSMAYIPAGVPIRGRVEGLRRIRHLDLHFDAAALTRRFGRSLDHEALRMSRFQFRDDRIAMLAGMIAAECGNDRPLHDLYGEGLLNALFASLFQIDQPDTARRRSPLSRRKLRLVTDYIDAHCLDRIRLADLAALTGLSETAMSHAFKAATGVPPHRWQMQARVDRAKAMMARDAASLGDIAEATGFFDQAHLTRVFKSIVGLTPGAWMRSTSRQ